MEEFTLGAYTWNRYTCTGFVYSYTMPEEKHDGCVFRVMILIKNDEHEISLEDADVKIILESLSQTN